LDRDQFGHDPQVRFLRRAFAGMEAAQNKLLKGINVSPFDGRLNRTRIAALKLFEKVWIVYSRWGISTDEGEMADVYMHCFVHILRAQRIPLPEGLFPADERIKNLISEVAK